MDWPIALTILSGIISIVWWISASYNQLKRIESHVLKTEGRIDDEFGGIDINGKRIEGRVYAKLDDMSSKQGKNERAIKRIGKVVKINPFDSNEPIFQE